MLIGSLFFNIFEVLNQYFLKMVITFYDVSRSFQMKLRFFNIVFNGCFEIRYQPKKSSFFSVILDLPLFLFYLMFLFYLINVILVFVDNITM